MVNEVPITIAVEGDLDEAVIKRILEYTGIQAGSVHGRKGKDWLRNNIRRYNEAARYSKWVVLVDLDHEQPCPPPLIVNWLPSKNPNLQLRIAVRMVEAWLLADRDNIAQFLAVTRARIPQHPEMLDNPKNTIIEVVRKSRSRNMRRDIIPADQSTAKQGPGYTTRLIEFALKHWDLNRASVNSPSLKRAISSLKRW